MSDKNTPEKPKSNEKRSSWNQRIYLTIKGLMKTGQPEHKLWKGVIDELMGLSTLDQDKINKRIDYCVLNIANCARTTHGINDATLAIYHGKFGERFGAYHAIEFKSQHEEWARKHFKESPGNVFIPDDNAPGHLPGYVFKGISQYATPQRQPTIKFSDLSIGDLFLHYDGDIRLITELNPKTQIFVSHSIQAKRPKDGYYDVKIILILYKRQFNLQPALNNPRVKRELENWKHD